MMRRFSTLLLVAWIVSACGSVGSGDVAVAPPTTTSTTQPSPLPTESAPVSSLPTGPDFEGVAAAGLGDDQTLVAMAAGDVPVFEQVGSEEPAMVFPGETILGTTTVFVVVEGPVEGWARVMLPTRPNGATGWVDLTEMLTYVVEGHVEVDLSDRTLTYYHGDDLIIETTVAVGGDSHPTPTGDFYVTDSVALSDPESPWGPYAFGLSARSEVITEYNGGDGIIGIHGTNRPDSIGKAVSLGCLRVPNEVIAVLHDRIPIGTPVAIRA